MGSNIMHNKLFISPPARTTRLKFATAIALIVHLVGAIGILFLNTNFFISVTPIVLLLNLALLFWTQPGKHLQFFVFFLLSFFIGMGAELIGVNTGWLFGNYRYSELLGSQVMGVPLLMGVNWFLLIYCSAVSVDYLFHRPSAGRRMQIPLRISGVVSYSTIVNGALLTTFFDWIMEPVALKLGYWTWMDSGNIPGFNYICWFAVSLLLLFILQRLRFEKHNIFAVHLMLIQFLFFLILRVSG
jgi:putative membrane protein